MSKRVSLGQKNTLFNYFSSPKGKPAPANGEAKDDEEKPTPKKEEAKGHTKNTIEEAVKESNQDKGSDSEEEVAVLSLKKRKRIIVQSDSDSENDSPNKPLPKNKSKKPRPDSDSEEDETRKHKTPKKSLKESSVKPKNTKSSGKDTNNTSRTSLKAFSFDKSGTPKASDKDAADSGISSQEASVPIPVQASIHTNWQHNKLEFLKPEKIRDASKRKADHPDYDPRTLFVPEDFLNSQTPAMRQWWILKSTHMDSVLFFKVGKFYELYHMDAVIGVKHLGFSYMRGEFAHSGFPESAYAKMAASLVAQGFKVARVEQTETPELMNERVKKMKKASKYDKVVKREICQITTKATCVYTAQMPEARNFLSCYLYAICEKPLTAGRTRFGICFIDTSIGVFHLAEFNDDKHCSRLLAVFSEYPPGLFLLERGKASTTLINILKACFGDISRDTLAPGSQFYSASKTLETLSTSSYFVDKDDQFKWPDTFKSIADDCLPKPDFELALKSLGACVWYLKDSEIDVQILSMGNFELYHPIDLEVKDRKLNVDYMVLDATTIRNLSLLGGKGTLQKTLDKCETAMGRRLLQRWICRPLCNIEKILERQKAICELYENPHLLQSAQEILKKMPDLERQVTKIHTYGNKLYAQKHPDSRAIFYEAKTYSKRKIIDLLKTLKAFERAQELCEAFKGCESRLLRKITQFEPVGSYIDLSSVLQFFKKAFNQEEAEKEGKILPKPGVDEEYDAAEANIASIQKELDKYLEEQRSFFGCKINYFGSDKKRYQLEVPEHRIGRVTNEYQLESSRKGVKRYSTATSRRLLHEMMQAETERAKIIHDLNRRIFEKFSQKQEQWEQNIYCITLLDILCSLAQYARTFSQDICIPKILPADDKPKIVMENGRHPCVLNIDTFVPNDVKMGVDNCASILLLTGPNMGGKSTLMRQVAVISVMAQMGSYVPASFCELNLVDRIFTRLGAYDNIIGGQSTFFVELSEAATILRHATLHSLVLLDELGRGTSTHDGNAIATAYVKKLTEIKCRTLFSTHYHTLVDRFVGRDDIQLGHMACMVENDDDPTQESVTFLYKLAQGRCPKSYGFNAARLAGLPDSIIKRGREVAKQLEQIAKNRQIIKKLFTSSVEEARQILRDL